MASAPAAAELHPAGIPELRDAAMKLLARGDTAEILRARASDPRYTGMLAFMSGTTADEAETDLLAFADTVADLEAEGLAPLDCYLLAGLDRDYDSYEAFLEEARSGR